MTATKTDVLASIDAVISQLQCRPRLRANARLALALPAGMLLGGCYHWGAVNLDTLSAQRTELGRVRLETEGGQQVTLDDANAEGGVVSGALTHRAAPSAPGEAERQIGQRVGYSLSSTRRLEQRRVNGGAVAGIVTGSVLVGGAGIAALVIHRMISGLNLGFGVSGGWGGGFGRRPAGLELGESREQTSRMGAMLAEMAELERASVPAFERLAHELDAHGAPGDMSSRALIAAEDERRHTRMIERLARHHGGAPRNVHVAPLPVRTLVELAIENAVEGCVNECWGALLARWQSGHAECPAMRATFGVIADEEAAHAALAIEVHEWALRRLDAASQSAVRAARTEAVDRLEASIRASFSDSAHAALGLPTPEQATALFAGARALLAQC